jgi:undecaprenyl-diphosphatase
MAGASLLKLVKYGAHYTGAEVFYLVLGMAVAFAVSWFVIKFLMDFVKRHNFKIFGFYRIALGIFVLLFFIIRNLTK